MILKWNVELRIKWMAQGNKTNFPAKPFIQLYFPEHQIHGTSLQHFLFHYSSLQDENLSIHLLIQNLILYINEKKALCLSPLAYDSQLLWLVQRGEDKNHSFSKYVIFQSYSQWAVLTMIMSGSVLGCHSLRDVIRFNPVEVKRCYPTAPVLFYIPYFYNPHGYFTIRRINSHKFVPIVYAAAPREAFLLG